LGLQIAAIEFARDVLGLTDASSTEFDEHTSNPVVYRMAEQEGVTNKGATMRLGAYRCKLVKGTKAYAAYAIESGEIRERHRHRYEFNSPIYQDAFEKAGMKVAGMNPDRGLVEILELKDHPFYIGVQFHPEFLSKPLTPHPLFRGLSAPR
jgi:CTP synthase